MEHETKVPQRLPLKRGHPLISEKKEAVRWWDTLSIAEMKRFFDVYETWGDWWSARDSMVFAIWDTEGRPEPLPLIPVK